MPDERKEASLYPIPGGDVRIFAYAFALSVGTCGLVMALIIWLIPEADRSHMVVALVTGLGSQMPSWLAYLKSHANGNATQEVKDGMKVNTVATLAVAQKVAPESVPPEVKSVALGEP